MNLRNLLIVITLALTFFSGCEVSFKSRADKLQDQKVYVSAVGCSDEEEAAKAVAIETLTTSTSIPTISKYSDLKRVSGAKVFCYDAFVTSVEWAKYLPELQKQREDIVLYTVEQNSTVIYEKKALLIDELLSKRAGFNDELVNAKLIAPIELAAFDLNQTRLEQSINAKPSAKIRVRSCSRGSNYNCLVGFISNAKDESKKIAYHWEFGDGDTSDRKNPLHTYKVVGDYNVTLQVQDIHEANTTVSAELKVSRSPRPVTLFSMNKSSYKTQEQIPFTNKSYSQKSKIKSYLWKFGDGKKSSKKSPSHIYSKAGEYVVKLKVCNRENFCSSASKKVTITEETALIDARKGDAILDHIADHGEPSKQIIKSNSLMTAYKYGDIWLLVKRGQIECAVKERGLSTNLMGQPKKCYWHEKHAKQYMVELK